MKKQYRAIGIMSGSSLDGLDVCLTTFFENDNKWSFKMDKAITIDIPDQLKTELRKSSTISSAELNSLDLKYGEWVGNALIQFFSDIDKETVDIISVHGHTVFHEPEKGISLQLGNGNIIAKLVKLPIVDNFRIDDIMKGGQGAPLVPVGEFHLFNEYDGFVNFGGISNMSTLKNEVIRAWDICPCNQVLNYLSSKLGHAFDKSGELAKSGAFDSNWFEELSRLGFFHMTPPKSLSNQWGKENILEKINIDPISGLRTYTDLIATLVGENISQHLPDGSKVLFTGGGAFNHFLVELIRKRIPEHLEIVIPPKETVEFKEALIFGFLGLLRLLEKPNIYASVTGAKEDSIAGQIHYPNS